MKKENNEMNNEEQLQGVECIVEIRSEFFSFLLFTNGQIKASPVSNKHSHRKGHGDLWGMGIGYTPYVLEADTII